MKQLLIAFPFLFLSYPRSIGISNQEIDDRALKDVYNFSPADDYVAFGEKNKMFIIGHTLVWHNQCPPWFFTNAAGKPNTKEEQIERLRSHIEVVAGRYAGHVNAWDVVNEVIDNDGSYRPTTWVKAIGNGDTLVK